MNASSYAIGAPANPAQTPEPVQQVQQQNAVNAQRQQQADLMVGRIKDGLKVAAIAANPEQALPNTRALGEMLAEMPDPRNMLSTLRRYIDA